MARCLLAFLITPVFILAASDAVSDEQREQDWQCTSQGHERHIEYFRRDGRTADGELACRVVYTKSGASEVLWQARNNPDYCEPKVLALVERLQAAGFQCRPVDSVAPPPELLPKTQAAPDDTDDILPAVSAPAAEYTPESRGGPESIASPRSNDAALRTLLEKHYVGSYLDAMIAAMPAGYTVASGEEAVSARPGEYLHVVPPNNFVKTMADGSYVLVNTTRLERGTTSAFVNFGFYVEDKRFRFLGYATIGQVADSRILEADLDRIVVSVAPAPVGSCVPTRRTEIIRWHSDIYGLDSTDAGSRFGGAEFDDCEE